MKIGLLMGSFDPIHNGHKAIARYALENNVVDNVWVVVSPQNPLKDIAGVEFERRLEMAKIAFQGEDGVEVCDIERELEFPNYTYNTVMELKKRYPNDKFSILCGSDIKQQLDKWYKIDDLRKEVNFLVYPRGGGECSVEFEGAKIMDVASSQIRQLINKNSLPNGVYEYIIDNDLYVDSWGAEEFYYRGSLWYAKGEFGIALNALNRALEVDPTMASANEMIGMIKEILAFRHTDLYNP